MRVVWGEERLKKMKVFLVDDEIVVREGIRESFPWEETPYTLVGEAPDGEMALPMIRDTNPDIVITDPEGTDALDRDHRSQRL